jgi:hypothetical protein
VAELAEVELVEAELQIHLMLALVLTSTVVEAVGQ